VNIDVFTLFPQWFEWFREQRHVSNALALGHGLETVDLRATTPLNWGQVDDTPFGGGAGMVLRVDVMEAALQARYGSDPATPSRRVIALTPGGRGFDDALAGELAAGEDFTLLCGRYEGFDERVRSFVDAELSVGDFVLSGGEVAAMAVIDACARLLPGVLGNAASAEHESHSEALGGLLEYPQFTRPVEFRGQRVPDVLQGGNHAAIDAWRRAEAERRTRERRPDLWQEAQRARGEEKP